MTQLFTTPARIIVTCNKRLSPYLQMEVEELELPIVRVFSTGVELQGTINDCIKLNLNLRCASQVLYSLKTFSCTGPEDVYKHVSAIAWEKIIPAEGYFSITSNVDHHSIRTPLFANVKVKDAIVDRMRQQTGSRPNSGPELDRTVIHLFWRNEQAELFLDTSGETLAKHGYRKIPGKAPMLEALAAATLLATKWDRKSAFVNPMCGSSTVGIEAALLATDRRPGLFRNNYSFMHLVGFDAGVYTTERRKLFERIKEVPGLKIIASDISADAINVSTINAAAAGVEQYMEFFTGDFEGTPVPGESGVVYFNPEYGERLGVEAELQATYARIGDFMKKKCKGYTGYIFTGNLELAKKIGLKASRRLEFYTSKIDCRLLEYELYAGTKKNVSTEQQT
ncbi:THUMP domain-containing class I SAM-dependent RNA methyltransferase [Aridibaculum aurantiacum]|uniref:THUMP domain-containing class I SAM-dependent RNA methyltransferase n=1 Tax=Aridibaculum aurantiacum TaxID=2810307 RepID=UPI001A962C83|nr:class I SAM-dependent RNA methyltransferase [Aridibaculum aurantiacum]